MSGGISIHAVDVVSGRPAVGMKIELRRLTPDATLIGSGLIGQDGTFPGAHVTGHGVTPGCYEVLFDVAGFYGRGPEMPFLGVVPFRFNVGSATEHIHLPLKFSPWGLALFRGI